MENTHKKYVYPEEQGYVTLAAPSLYQGTFIRDSDCAKQSQDIKRLAHFDSTEINANASNYLGTTVVEVR